MNSEEQKGLVENPGWKEFRDWVKATVEQESNTVVSRLEDARLKEARGRRDAFEDVWAMILAFEGVPLEKPEPRMTYAQSLAYLYERSGGRWGWPMDDPRNKEEEG